MFDLPRPDQIIEELADKVRAQIDRDAPVAFDSALSEMTQYHRFLLGLSASQTTDGQPLNLAEIAGDAWAAPHEEWNRQYVRLFERATVRLADNDHYVRSLAYIPSRVLPRREDPRLSQNTLTAINDIFPAFVHRLEAWVTRRALQAKTDEHSPQKATLMGSDAKAYEGVLPELVGANEGWLQRIPWLFDWDHDATNDYDEVWARYRGSWPILWRHLQNTAYCLAATVWNEDRLGADYFRDALVRWRQTLSYKLDRRADLRWHRLLMPDIMKLKWTEAQGKAAALGYDYDPEPNPTEVFTSVVHQAHDDVLNLTAATLLYWSLARKQQSDLGVQTARLILERKVLDDDTLRPVHRQLSFRHLLLDVLRIEMAGFRFQEGVYGADLDRLVSRLDNMTERAVVTGRVFTPSTIHGREELRPAIVALLTAWLPDKEDASLEQSVIDLAAKVTLLPDEDGSLRSILHEIRSCRSVLENPSDSFLGVIASLGGKRDAGTAANQLYAVLGKIEILIDEARLKRLNSTPIDQVKIDDLRNKVEEQLLEIPAKVSFFSKFKIETDPLPDPSNVFTARLSGIGKGQFVTPPMEQESVNLSEVLSSSVCSSAARRIWGLFTMRPRIPIEIAARLEDEAFWQKAGPYIASVGPSPVLVVSITAEARSFRRFMYSDAKAQSGLRIERQLKGKAEGRYIANVEGVDVFGADFDAGVAWLFSSETLQRIVYAELDEHSHFVEASFEEDDTKKGSLAFRFYQRVEWEDLPIYEIKMLDPETE
ncbi:MULTISPECIES: hypothetical protein [Rhizobium]|uniref:Uncharacterized protein n=1 Tax=Rhizobium esperanzae TaxID=1967781 RepID=A0A7W6XWT4_9HYPH|nr:MULTISPECIES: hypothetical protein [Rhizobium]MBB4440782.1 hypothetical protein [Rhizobium esperanzae]MDH6203419.1 hypothetical protein [Rhizobium leguminosarum]